MNYETLLYEQDRHVVTLTYNRPDQHNAVNRAMNAELHHAWERFRDDDEAFVLVITGAGETTFCAGWDLQDAAQLTEIGDYDAFRVGLHNEIVPRGDALARARKLAHEIAALPQGAIRSDKESIMRGVGRTLEERLRIEAEMVISMFMRGDSHTLGATAFKEGKSAA